MRDLQKLALGSARAPRADFRAFAEIWPAPKWIKRSLVPARIMATHDLRLTKSCTTAAKSFLSVSIRVHPWFKKFRITSPFCHLPSAS
jgi:hypothetical protein